MNKNKSWFVKMQIMVGNLIYGKDEMLIHKHSVKEFCTLRGNNEKE